jgi:WXG100 family type VII secretion target
MFGQHAEACRRAQETIRRAKEALEGGDWIGQGATAFYREMDSEVLVSMTRLVTALDRSSADTLTISRIMKQAEEDAARLFRLVGAGAAAAAAGAAAAGEALAEEASRESRSDRRSDRRVDRRIESDRRWRRQPGGSRGGSHLDYDWAGGAILERYLTGGADWNIRNDPRWTVYMQSNQYLTTDLRDRTLDTARDMYRMTTGGGPDRLSINESYSMEIENGEGVVGYQYLHGTNVNVGGFQRQGTATIAPDGAGGYVATMDMTYTWNDVIDPNPQYTTDNWKSTVAEIITLGQAEAYEMHISWTERTVVHLDSGGNPTSIGNQ